MHLGATGAIAVIAGLLLAAAPAIAAIMPHADIPTWAEGPPARAGGSLSSGAEVTPGNTMGDDRGGTHGFRLSELRPVAVDGVDYYVFLLDPEETNPGHSPDGALDVLRLYVAERADIRSLDALTAEGSLLIDLLIGGGAGWMRERETGDRGRGGNRIEYLVPSNLCRGIDPDRYLYLYSRFAATSGGSGRGPSLEDEDRRGPAPRDQWPPPGVPEPTSLLLVAPGLLAVALAGRRTRG